MSNLYKYKQNENATVCAGKNCVTVYGDVAHVVNGIVVGVILITALSYVIKVFREVA